MVVVPEPVSAVFAGHNWSRRGGLLVVVVADDDDDDVNADDSIGLAELFAVVVAQIGVQRACRLAFDGSRRPQGPRENILMSRPWADDGHGSTADSYIPLPLSQHRLRVRRRSCCA